jgi:RNA-binding protein
MTGKERAGFRAMANSLEPEFQIGKGGISDGVIKQTEDAFNTKELIKVKVLLDSSPETPRAIADKLAEAVSCEVIQIIGGVIVLYKKNENAGEKKKKNAKPAKKSKPLSNVKAKRAAAAKRTAEEKLARRDFYSKRRTNNK